MFTRFLILALVSGTSAAAATLYGVTGDGASPRSTLFILDKSNASTTLVGAFGNGNDGEVIAFNPVNGLLYHWSGGGTQVMESTPLAAVSVTNIPQSGAAHGEIFGAIWDAANARFLVSDVTTKLFTVTTAGFYTELGSLAGTPTPNDIRGMVFVGGTLYGAEVFNPTLYTIDPSGPTVLTTITITLSGLTLAGLNDIAIDPDTGIVWAIARLNTGSRRLATLNLQTGELTSVGTLGANFSSLAFGPATASPEPSTVLLSLLGFAGLGLAKRLRRP